MVDQSNVQGKVIVIADRRYESFNNAFPGKALELINKIQGIIRD